MNSEDSKTSYPHKLLLSISDKINLKISDNYVALSNLSVYYTWKNIKQSHKIKFRISGPKWNHKSELPDRLYTVSDIQDYSYYIIKKHETATDNPPIRTYVNQIENRITFRIKKGYYLKLLTPETMKLLGSTKSKKK